MVIFLTGCLSLYRTQPPDCVFVLPNHYKTTGTPDRLHSTLGVSGQHLKPVQGSRHFAPVVVIDGIYNSNFLRYSNIGPDHWRVIYSRFSLYCLLLLLLLFCYHKVPSVSPRPWRVSCFSPYTLWILFVQKGSGKGINKGEWSGVFNTYLHIIIELNCVLFPKIGLNPVYRINRKTFLGRMCPPLSGSRRVRRPGDRSSSVVPRVVQTETLVPGWWDGWWTGKKEVRCT